MPLTRSQSKNADKKRTAEEEFIVRNAANVKRELVADLEIVDEEPQNPTSEPMDVDGPLTRPSSSKLPPKYAANSVEPIADEILITNDTVEIEDETEEDWQDDDEIDETFVIVDINGFIDEDIIQNRVNKGLCRVRQPGSERPIIQVGGQLFTGKYRETDGSIMILEEHKDSDSQSFTLSAITDVLLEARKSYLYAKGDAECQPGENTQRPITMRMEQLKNQALPNFMRKKL